MGPILVAFRIVLMLFNTAVHMLVLWIHGWIFGHTISLGFAYRRSWARRSLWILGIKVDCRVVGSTAGPALIVSNHRSLTDPVVQLAYLDMFIIAKDEVGKIPVIGRGAMMTGIVFVKRDKLNSRFKAREATTNILKGGNSVLVYPEGTTTTGRTSGPFKPGTFKVATEVGVPVLPVAIEYKDEKDYWAAHGMSKQLLRQIGRINTHVRMIIGPVVESGKVEDLMQQVKSQIDSRMLKLQEGWFLDNSKK